MELRQKTFLRGSRFIRLTEDDTLHVQIRQPGKFNEYPVQLDVLHEQPTHVKQHATKFLPAIVILCLLLVLCVIGIFVGKNEATPVAAGFSGPWLLLFLIAVLIRMRRESFDLLVFHNRFNGQPAFNLFIDRPNKTEFHNFVDRLIARIKELHADLSVKAGSIPSQLQDFAALRERGILSEEEFGTIKQKLIATALAEPKQIGF